MSLSTVLHWVMTRHVSKDKLQQLLLHACQHRMEDPWAYFNTHKGAELASSKKEGGKLPVIQDY